MRESKFAPARKIAGEIGLMLAEHPPEIQAVILAELIGAFLAGHIVEGDPYATLMMRFSIAHELVNTARALIVSADEHRIAGHA